MPALQRDAALPALDASTPDSKAGEGAGTVLSAANGVSTLGSSKPWLWGPKGFPVTRRWQMS